VRIVDIPQRPQRTLGLGQPGRLVFVAAREQQLRADGRGLGADVQAIGQPEQRRAFTRIAFIEYVADVDFDRADDGAGGLELLVGRQLRGARLLDARVFEIGDLGAGARAGSGGQDCQRAQPGQVSKVLKEPRYRSRPCGCGSRAGCR
jgi:hypothetical protein